MATVLPSLPEGYTWGLKRDPYIHESLIVSIYEKAPDIIKGKRAVVSVHFREYSDSALHFQVAADRLTNLLANRELLTALSSE